MTKFEWTEARGRGICNYLYHEDDEGFSRSVGIASVYPLGNGYRVSVSWQFDALLTPKAYILNKRFATLEAAKRAVERKIPGLVAVLKIQGVKWI
jgi:hypothetical protein